MAETSFAENMKRHQLAWALANGVTPDMLETRNGQPSWVLKEEHRERNLPEPVGGNEDVITAFNSIVPDDPVRVIDPGAVVRAIADEGVMWTRWAATMRSRYQL